MLEGWQVSKNRRLVKACVTKCNPNVAFQKTKKVVVCRKLIKSIVENGLDEWIS